MNQTQEIKKIEDSRLTHLNDSYSIWTFSTIREVKEMGEINYLVMRGMEGLEDTFWDDRPNWNETEYAVYGKSYVIELESTPLGFKDEGYREFWRVILTAPFNARKAVKCSNPYKLVVGEPVDALEYDCDGVFRHPTKHSRYANGHDALCNGCRLIRSME